MKKIIICLSLLSFSLPLLAYDPEALIAMSDQELFNAGLHSNGAVGKCEIRDYSQRPLEPVTQDTNMDAYCDFQALTGQSYSSIRTKTAYTGNMGLPHGNGFGCIIAPNHPRKFTKCSTAKYERYDKYKNDPMTDICTKDHIKNGANMLRIGIIKGLCDPDAIFQAAD